VNEVMAQYFREPYPARAAVGVAALPKGAAIEMDAVMVLEKKSSPQRRKGRKEKRLRVKTKKSS